MTARFALSKDNILPALYYGAIATIGVTPFISDYVLLGLGLLGLTLAVARRDLLLVSPTVIMLVLAPLLLLATLPFVYGGVEDLIPFGAVLLVLAAPGIAAILAGPAAHDRRLAFHISCLIGVAGALLLGLGEIVVTGTDRVGAGNNPIHYAALSVMLGFLALPGVGATKSAWRIVFLLGPVLAILVTLISGSRGPLMAVLLLVLVSVILLLVWFRHDKLVVRTFMLLSVAALGLFAILATSSRALSILGDIWGMVTGGPTLIDAYRAAMFQTALDALVHLPLHGLGFSDVMPTVTSRHPELELMHTLHDLHSDPANLMASAGVPGLLAYLLLVGAPLALWRSRDKTLNMTIILLVVGQVALGLTNTTIGILPQTMLFCAAMASCQAAAMRARVQDAGSGVQDNL